MWASRRAKPGAGGEWSSSPRVFLTAGVTIRAWRRRSIRRPSPGRCFPPVMARGVRGIREARSGRPERRGPRTVRRGRLVERQARSSDQAARAGLRRPTRARGKDLDAARVALTLSWDETNRGAFSVAQGWFATAERLLENREESAEHGRIALTRASNAMFAEGNYPLGDRAPRPRVRARGALRRPGHADARARRQGARAHEERRDREGARAPRRGLGRGSQRRAPALLDDARLLHDDQLVPGRR